MKVTHDDKSHAKEGIDKEVDKMFHKNLTDRKWHERLAIHVLKAGAAPSHVAFIMDGNRRFARHNQLSSIIEGYRYGSKKLHEVNLLQSLVNNQ